jgi:hypothetical protein
MEILDRVVAATCAAPIVPPAPGLLSTITGCPSCFVKRSPTARAMVSVPEPAVKGTTRRIGWRGYALSWACATPQARPVASRQAAAALRNFFISYLQHVFRRYVWA